MPWPAIEVLEPSESARCALRSEILPCFTRPATVRGKIVMPKDQAVGDIEVRAQAADLRENRYYDPTTKAAEEGSFELKFIRPGKQ